jgi:hypothetical protein
MTDEKEYTTPELTPLGNVEELTKGTETRGTADQMWFFHWEAAASISG